MDTGWKGEDMDTVHTKTEKTLYTMLFIFFGVSIAVLVLGFGLWLMLGWETSVTTESDLKTDADRIQYIQTRLPITIPSSASRISLNDDGERDWQLDAAFDLPLQDYTQFKNKWNTFASKRTSRSDGKVMCNHNFASVAFDDKSLRVSLTASHQ